MYSAIGFILISFILYPIILLVIFKAGKQIGKDKRTLQKQTVFISVGMIVWGIYLGILSTKGLFADTALPPKIPFLTFIPFLVLTVFFYRRLKGNEQLQAIPLPWFFGIQSFRIIVEIFIVVAISDGILPKSAGMEGYNYDVLVGITGLITGLVILRKAPQSIFWLKIWNIWGIAMIFVVAGIIVTSHYQPQLWGAETTLIDTRFFEYPHLLLPFFLAPTAIFIHFMTLRKLKELKNGVEF